MSGLNWLETSIPWSKRKRQYVLFFFQDSFVSLAHLLLLLFLVCVVTLDFYRFSYKRRYPLKFPIKIKSTETLSFISSYCSASFSFLLSLHLVLFSSLSLALPDVLGKAFFILCADCWWMSLELLKLSWLRFCRDTHPSFSHSPMQILFMLVVFLLPKASCDPILLKKKKKYIVLVHIVRDKCLLGRVSQILISSMQMNSGSTIPTLPEIVESTKLVTKLSQKTILQLTNSFSINA